MYLFFSLVAVAYVSPFLSPRIRVNVAKQNGSGTPTGQAKSKAEAAHGQRGVVPRRQSQVPTEACACSWVLGMVQVTYRVIFAIGKEPVGVGSICHAFCQYWKRSLRNAGHSSGCVTSTVHVCVSQAYAWRLFDSPFQFVQFQLSCSWSTKWCTFDHPLLHMA